MRTNNRCCLLFSTFFLLLSVHSFAGNALSPEQKADVEEWMHNRGAKGFMENKGQMTDDKNNPVPNVLFKSELPGVDLYLTTGGFTYVFLKYTEKEEKESEKDKEETKTVDDPLSIKEGLGEAENMKTDYARVDIILKGGTIKKENIITEYPSQEDYRYYLGHCPKGITGVREYKKITIKEVYAGIDWVWYVNKNGAVKYDFEVHAHSDPNQIQMQYKWADIKTLNQGKSLHISTPVGELTEGSAVSYNSGKTIATSYRLKNNTVSFITGRYNSNESLTIDPPLQLVWSSVYGGNDYGWTTAITCDITGNVFVTGCTGSSNFPTLNPSGGAYYKGTYEFGGDCFILKFDKDGVRKWATYYGGNYWEYGNSICTDAAGNIFITGQTRSTNHFNVNPGSGAYFQNSSGGLEDVFILKFDVSGVLVWATYYGGNGDDKGFSICADAAGNVFVTGYTGSSNFPTLNPGSPTYFQGYGGFSDGFILKFTNSGVLIWATYYGGNSDDRAYSICTDAMGNIFVTGYTNSSSGSFPTLDPGSGAYFQGVNKGGFDCFILKLTNSGQLLWGTYYGGSSDEGGNIYFAGLSITTDITGNIFITGYTVSSDFPTFDPGAGAFFQAANAGSYDCFIMKFTNSGVRSWATYYGGNGAIFGDCGSSICTDIIGNVFVSGVTYSTNIPTVDPGAGAYFQGANGGNGNPDLFFAMFTNSGTMQWSTYFGGVGLDDKAGIAINPVNRDLYFTGDGGGFSYSASTYTTFPSVDPGGGAWFQNQPGNPTDYTIVGRFSAAALPDYTVTTVFVTTTNSTCFGTNNGIATATVYGGTEPYAYLWTPGGQTTQTITGLAAGTYTVIVTDALSRMDTATVIITEPSILTLALNSVSLTCNGMDNGAITAAVNGGTWSYSYLWNNMQTKSTITHLISSLYSVTVTDKNGCTITSSVFIDQPPPISVTLTATRSTCGNANGSANIAASGGTLPYSYSWNMGATSSQISSLIAQIYSVTVTDANNCTAIDTVVVSNISFTVIATGDTTILLGDSILLNVTVGISYLWNPATGLNCTTCQTPIASPTITTIYCVTVTDINGCSDSACVTINVENNCEDLFIPTAFSPNNDNNNDCFRIYGAGSCFKSLDLTVFDRWGEKVFETDDLASSTRGWDGTYKNKELNTGVFVYYFKALTLKGEKMSKHGNIFLIR